MDNKSKEYKAKPILRFLARYIDSVVYLVIFFILSSIYFVVLGFLGGDVSFLDSGNEYLYFIIIIIFFILIETAVLTTFQTTAGKKFLNISIEKKDGSEIKFKDALKRTVLLWVRGLGLGIPIVSFITQLVAYGNLSTDNQTSWDRDSNFEVINHSVPKWRIAIAFVIFIATIAFRAFMVFGAQDYISL